METQMKLTGKSTMQEVLETYPSARRALFQKYHIGGCSSCGYELADPLEKVLASHNVLDVSGAIEFIQKSQQTDDKLIVAPKEVAALLKSGNSVKLLDVREPEENETAKIPGSELLTQEMVWEIKDRWAKDTQMVFYCHHGLRSLDAAAYFAGHGFTKVQSIRGGIDAWSQEVDSSVPRY